MRTRWVGRSTDKASSSTILISMILYGVLDLNWVHVELAPYYSHTGRPSIDPQLMIRMLIIGYVFAIRSERRICAEVQVNLAYRWFLPISSGYLGLGVCDYVDHAGRKTNSCSLRQPKT